MRRVVVFVVGLLVLQATPAGAAAPAVVRQGTCSDGARSRLELTDLGDRIKVRFVLHQMTLPGHRWRIVLGHFAGIAGPHPGGYGVFFEGIRLATGDSGDITVRRSVVNSPILDWVKATARDRQTGQICGVHDGPLQGLRPSGREPEQSIPPGTAREPTPHGEPAV